MSTKDDLLRNLTIKELRQLAKENRIKLVKEGWLGISTYSVSRKKEIIEILLASPSITKKKILNIIEPKEEKMTVKMETTRKHTPSHMKVEKFVDLYFYKEDLQDLLEQEGLHVSGTKAELIRRLRREANYDIFQFIFSLQKDELKFICEDLDLKTTGKKDELAERVFNEIVEGWTEDYFMKEMRRFADNQGWSESELEEFLGKEEKERVETPKRERIPKVRGKDDFSSLISAIERWIPLRRYKNEEGYQVDLRNYLEHKFGYQVRQETGETMADIMVNNIFPIEVKKNPRLSGYDRLMGQLTRHHRAKGYAIAVICDVRRLEQFEDFKHNVSKHFEKNVVIISR